GEVVRSRFVYVADGLIGVPAWQVRFLQPLPLSSWIVEVDARDGSVLASDDLAHAATAKANVWTNPIRVSGNVDLRDNPFGIGSDPTGLTGADDLSKYYQEVTLLDLTDAGGASKLVGPYVTIVDSAAAGLEYKFGREDPRFEEAMAYYWVDFSQRNIRELGFKNINDYSIPVFAHDQPTVVNAFYLHGLPEEDGTGSIHFGYHGVNRNRGAQGFADAAEDAEVIVHEFGHSVLNNQVPGFGRGVEGGAMHEGWGDFWAASEVSRVNGEKLMWCTAPWMTQYIKDADAPGEPPCLRKLENDFKADFKDREVHGLGQVWSGALWNVRKTMPSNTEMERLILEAHFLMPQSGKFAEGAEALLVADLSLHGAAHASAILDVFGARDIGDLALTDDLLTAMSAQAKASGTTGLAPIPNAGANATPGIEIAILVGILAIAAHAQTRRRGGAL
ncbi:MAG TPA: M36 family metallopeptidase, partial [Burkholderiales bacterium]|nr:M36 family metallopeptidase [Burkholderiales bacterium]